MDFELEFTGHVNVLQSISVQIFPKFQDSSGAILNGPAVNGVSFETENGTTITTGRGHAIIDAHPNDQGITDYVESGMLASPPVVTGEAHGGFWEIFDSPGFDSDPTSTTEFRELLEQVEDALDERGEDPSLLSGLVFHSMFLTWIWSKGPPAFSYVIEWDLWECVELTAGGCGGPMFPGSGRSFPEDITLLDMRHYQGGWKAVGVGKPSSGGGGASMKGATSPGQRIPNPR